LPSFSSASFDDLNLREISEESKMFYWLIKRYPQKAGYCSISNRNGFLNHIRGYHELNYQTRNQLQTNKIQIEVVHPYLPSEAEVKKT
jgi:hypothetical protein